MKQESLATLKSNLSESDIDAIVSIVGSHCRLKTVQRIRSILTYGAGTIGNFGIYSRLIKEPNGIWGYCAGQSYTDEIRTLRECILGK